LAHARTNCRNLSTTISLEETLLSQIEDYRFTARKNNRSAAIADLIQKGLKYQALMEKKRAVNNTGA
jgi:metal-responsive CopG/Arc/MetJ family transcriptional regulator